MVFKDYRRPTLNRTMDATKKSWSNMENISSHSMLFRWVVVNPGEAPIARFAAANAATTLWTKGETTWFACCTQRFQMVRDMKRLRNKSRLQGALFKSHGEYRLLKSSEQEIDSQGVVLLMYPSEKKERSHGIFGWSFRHTLCCVVPFIGFIFAKNQGEKMHKKIQDVQSQPACCYSLRVGSRNPSLVITLMSANVWTVSFLKAYII